MIKTNEDGIINPEDDPTTWELIYGKETDEVARSIDQTKDGNYVVVGSTHSAPSSDSDVIILRVDTKGNIYYEDVDLHPGYDYGKYVEATDDGGFILAGSYEDSSSKKTMVFLEKRDKNNDKNWRTYFKTNNDGNHYSTCVRETSDGGYIISGWVELEEYVDWMSPSTKSFLIKTDARIYQSSIMNLMNSSFVLGSKT